MGGAFWTIAVGLRWLAGRDEGLRITSSWLGWSGLAAVTCDLIDDIEQRLAVLVFGERFENLAIQSICRAYGTALTEGIYLGTGQLAFGDLAPIGWIADLRSAAIAHKTLDISGALIRQKPSMNGGSVQNQATEQTHQ